MCKKDDKIRKVDYMTPVIMKIEGSFRKLIQVAKFRILFTDGLEITPEIHNTCNKKKNAN